MRRKVVTSLGTRKKPQTYDDDDDATLLVIYHLDFLKKICILEKFFEEHLKQCILTQRLKSILCTLD